MKIFQIIKRVSGSVSGFVASVVQTGVALTTRMAITATTTAPAVAIDAARQSGRIDQTPGVDIDVLGVTGTVASPAHTPGVATSAVISAFTAPEAPALEIAQVTFTLAHLSGSNAATNTGADAWTNPTNAQGLHNASNATSAGEALAARTRVLELAYANHANKSALTITLVRLHFYVQQAGTVAVNGDLRLRRDVGDGAGFVTLATITGNENDLTTPRTFDISAAIAGDWTRVDALRAAVEHRTDVGESLITAAVDAVEVEIVANVTMVP